MRRVVDLGKHVALCRSILLDPRVERERNRKGRDASRSAKNNLETENAM